MMASLKCTIVLVVFVALSVNAWTTPTRCRLSPSKHARRTTPIVFGESPTNTGNENVADNDRIEDIGSDEIESTTHQPESVIRVDDGGSDLTDRFKYKVNALMGAYDPKAGADDENQDGNILDAMMKFPAYYDFNVVGRTNDEETTKEEFVERVKRIVGSASSDPDSLEYEVTPRGKAFTRVTAQVLVESAAVVTSTYAELKDIEITVMAY